VSVDPTTGFTVPDTGYFESGVYVTINWLKTKVPQGWPIESNVPNPRPTRLIVVTGATTSSDTDNSDAATILGWRRNIIHVYAETEALSVRFAEMVRGYMVDGWRAKGSGYRGLKIIGDVFFFPEPADPAKTPRAQLTVDILLRARYSAYGPSVTP
jgi:hypothetical protein